MQYTTFILEIQRLKPHLDGSGKEICESAGLSDMTQYYNVTSGKIKDPDVLRRVYDASVEVIRNKINVLKSVIQ